MNRTPVRFDLPQYIPNTYTGQFAPSVATTAEATVERYNFFDALRAITPTLIVTGIAIGIASGLGTTIGSTLGTLILSRFEPKHQKTGRARRRR